MVNYKQAEFLFVVKHVSAVPPPDIEQVPVSIFAAADQRAASAAEPRLSRGVVTYSPVRQLMDCNKKTRIRQPTDGRARKQVGVAARRFR